ncbi:hypothetical protein FB45DRAFT_1030484 [Roridomyces roridus]|uniref:Uncharacterized protein n=1 Tax=Roridomyces roridus TaxID=1738132 RepID=A0AAD7FLA1_9AGAR|nr:hypothetical protein FB45DRAFT_1030484 [Roridomyces roridus]
MSTIHPALLPRNISKLPLPLQRVARHAMSQGSWMSTSLKTWFQQLGELRPEENLGLLPALYTLLDPSLIPSPESDTATKVRTSMHSTMMTWAYLESSLLHNPMFPLTATVDLWPRVWAWMEFFSLYSYSDNDPVKAAQLFRLSRNDDLPPGPPLTVPISS